MRAAFLLAFVSLPAIASDLPFFTLTSAAQAVDLRRGGSLEHPYKFDEHSETKEGLALEELVIEAIDEKRKSFLRIRAFDAGERDQQLWAEGGIFGAWRASLSFDGFPRLYTTSTRSPFSYLGDGRLAVDEALRRELETSPDQVLAQVARRIATRAPLTRVGFQRNRLAGAASWTPRPSLTVRATARDEARNGTRPFSIGAFDSGAILFEFAEPVEVRTSEFTFGASVRGGFWHVDADASVMRFRNTITDIDYDNPFRVSYEIGPLRAPRGIATSTPDSAAQSIRASGHVEVGDRTRVGASLAWIDMRQDQRFAPWTLNVVLPGSGLPEGTGPVNIEALPRPSLRGRANVLTTEDSLAFTLRRDLTLTFRYRDYDYNNDTPELAFPGYVGGGDAFWRTEFRGQPVVAVPRSHRRQSGQTELVWRRGSTRARLSHEREIWTREHRKSIRTEQDALTGSVQFRSGDLSGSATIRHARRDGDSPADPSALVRFDAAERVRSDGRVRLQWAASEKIGITAAVGSLSDDYGAPRVGMQRFAAHEATFDVRWAISDRSEIMARLARHAAGYEYAQLIDASSGDRWLRDVEDGANTTGIEYDTTAGRFAIHLGYERETAAQSIRTRGAEVARPRVTTDFQQIRADVQYELTPRWQVGLRYRYEPFALDDYATNGLSSYPLDAFSPEIDARRVMLLDARYGGHEAHVLALYFRLASE